MRDKPLAEIETQSLNSPKSVNEKEINDVNSPSIRKKVQFRPWIKSLKSFSVPMKKKLPNMPHLIKLTDTESGSVENQDSPVSTDSESEDDEIFYEEASPTSGIQVQNVIQKIAENFQDDITDEKLENIINRIAEGINMQYFELNQLKFVLDNSGESLNINQLTTVFIEGIIHQTYSLNLNCISNTYVIFHFQIFQKLI